MSGKEACQSSGCVVLRLCVFVRTILMLARESCSAIWVRKRSIRNAKDVYLLLVTEFH